jgi:hypothetical protein
VDDVHDEEAASDAAAEREGDAEDVASDEVRICV